MQKDGNAMSDHGFFMCVPTMLHELCEELVCPLSETRK